MECFSLQPVGVIRSCFKEKFAIPRQAILAPAAQGTLELLAPYNHPDAVKGLELCSHLWLTFIFHQATAKKDQRLVKAPRLGGNQKLGVFATRSTHRPNNLGLSLVKLERVTAERLYLSSIDLLDGTPVLDIKPYLPYADCPTDAVNQFAPDSPITVAVTWSEQALSQATQHQQRLAQPLIELINQCLAQDPKPAYQKPTPERRYGVCLYDLNIQWHYPSPELIQVLEVTQLLEKP